MQQLWDKLRRKVNDVQSKLPAGAGPSVVNDDFGDVLGVFYGLTGEGYSYRELENQAKLIKNVLLRVKDVAKVEIYGVQSPTIDVILNPSVMARSGITTADISRAFDAQNRVVDAGGIDAGVNRIRIESTGNFYSLDDIRNLTIVSRTGEHFRLADIAEIKESYQTPPSNKMRINGQPAVGIAISTIPTGNVVDMAEAVKLVIDRFTETMSEGFELQTIYDQGYESAVANQGFILESDHICCDSSSYSVVLHRIQEWHPDRQRIGVFYFCYVDCDVFARNCIAAYVTCCNYHCHGNAGR